jgi:sugar phosphate isomerase/epimerase
MAKQPIIAAQLFTLRDYVKTEEEFFKTLEKVKEIGYDCVQISAVGPYRADALKDKLDALGMSVCVTHDPLDKILERTDEIIEHHKLLGIKYAGLGGYVFNNMEDCKSFVEKIVPVAKKFRDNGIKFVYHNHAHEFVKFDNGVRPMDYILENTSPDEVGILADMFWLQSAGVSPTKFIADNAERLNVVHFKDMKYTLERTQNMAAIFDGNMDYDSIYDACLKAGVEYIAVEQDMCYGRCPFDELKLSRENIKKRLGV